MNHKEHCDRSEDKDSDILDTCTVDRADSLKISRQILLCQDILSVFRLQILIGCFYNALRFVIMTLTACYLHTTSTLQLIPQYMTGFF